VLGDIGVMEKMAENTKKTVALRVLICFGLAVVCFVVVLLTTGVRYRFNDDAAISNIAAGAYGPDTQYLVYVNVLLGWFLKPFYALVPSLNWFVILQAVGGLCCFAYLGCLLLQKLGLWRGLCAYTVFLALVGFDFLQVFHYVQYAALFLAVGLVVVARNMGKNLSAALAGCAVVLMGGMLRFQQFIAIGGLAAAVLLYKFFKLEKNQKLRAAAVVAGLVVVAFGLKGIDTWVYARAPGWAEYVRFNTARTQISDFRMQYATAEDFAEMGYSEADFGMFKSWNFYDPEVFSTEQVEQIANTLPPNDTLPNAVNKTLQTGLDMLYGRPANWLFTGVLVGWLFAGRRKNWPVLLGTLALLAAEVFYLQWRGRMPDTIEFSLVIAAILFCAMCCEKPEVKLPGMAGAGVVLLACSLPAFVGFAQVAADYWPSRTGRAAEFESAVQDKDTLYLADVLLFDAANGYDVWHPRPQGYFSNVVFTGSWLMHTPPQQQALQNFGIGNLYADSVDRDDVVFLDLIHADMKTDYMRQHYDADVKIVRIEEGINLHKYVATTKPPEDEAQ
jgi:hypothetical protein